MYFSPIIPFIPPKFFDHHFNVIAQTQWYSEATHCKRRNSLYNKFDQHLTPCLWQQSSFPPLQFLPHPFLNIIEASFFSFPNQWGKAYILLNFVHPKQTFNNFFSIIWGGFAKEECCFAYVNFLAWNTFIGKQEIENNIALIGVGFAKQ